MYNEQKDQQMQGNEERDQRGPEPGDFVNQFEEIVFYLLADNYINTDDTNRLICNILIRYAFCCSDGKEPSQRIHLSCQLVRLHFLRECCKEFWYKNPYYDGTFPTDIRDYSISVIKRFNKVILIWFSMNINDKFVIYELYYMHLQQETAAESWLQDPKHRQASRERVFVRVWSSR